MKTQWSRENFWNIILKLVCSNLQPCSKTTPNHPKLVSFIIIGWDSTVSEITYFNTIKCSWYRSFLFSLFLKWWVSSPCCSACTRNAKLHSTPKITSLQFSEDKITATFLNFTLMQREPSFTLKLLPIGVLWNSHIS